MEVTWRISDVKRTRSSWLTSGVGATAQGRALVAGRAAAIGAAQLLAMLAADNLAS